MKKNTFKRVLTGFLAVVMLFAMISCTTKLNGTYTSVDGLVKQSFTFDREDNVKVSAFGIDVDGKYVIEDGKITITYSFMGLSYDFERSFEKDGKSIFVDGVEFVKEK